MKAVQWSQNLDRRGRSSVQADSPVSDVVINSITADSALCQACSHLPSHMASMPVPVTLLAERCLRLLSSCAQIGVKPTTHEWQVWCRTCWYLYLYLPAIPRVPHPQGPPFPGLYLRGRLEGWIPLYKVSTPRKFFITYCGGSILICLSFFSTLLIMSVGLLGLGLGLKSTPCNTL